jgi:hypothetical protein
MAGRDYAGLVRQLRAKADSTNFPDEANALRTKADAIEAAHIEPKQPPPSQRGQARQPRMPTGWKPQDGNIPPQPVMNIADMDSFLRGFMEGQQMTVNNSHDHGGPSWLFVQWTQQ